MQRNSEIVKYTLPNGTNVEIDKTICIEVPELIFKNALNSHNKTDEKTLIKSIDLIVNGIDSDWRY